MSPPVLLLVTAIFPALATLFGIFATYVLSRKREQEAEWRKLKFSQYQEYVLALSGVVQGRETLEAHRRYADAVNSLALVGSPMVLSALKEFQAEVSYLNGARSDERHDALLVKLLHAMRHDIHPTASSTSADYSFRLLGLPPDASAEAAIKQAVSTTRRN